MSISAYVGLPGHGKSYGAVENVIIPALKAGRRVFTNIPFDEDLMLQHFNNAPIPFETSELQKNPDWFQTVFIAGAVLVFDECWRLWPSGLKAHVVLEQHKSFLAEHRHMVGDDGQATEIYLVTQDLSQIANFARALVETTYRMVKRINIGFDNHFRVDIYEGSVTGAKPSKDKLIRSDSGKFKKEIYQFYKSHTMSKTGGAGNEKRVDSRGNAFGRLSIKLGVIAILVLVPFVFYGLNNVKAGYRQEPVVNKPQVTNVPQGTKVVRAPKKPAFLSDAKFLFISHRITVDSVTKIYLDVEFDKSRVVMDLQQLSALGYSARAMSECLFEITGYDFAGYVMCDRPAKKEGIIQSLVAPSLDNS